LTVAAASNSQVDSVVVNSARVVIRKVELESEEEDSLEFELKEPFIQDLNLLDNQTVLTTVNVPAAVYEELEIKVGPLRSSAGQIYQDNPELQDKSLLLEGYVVKGTQQDFSFSSEIELEQEYEFEPPVVVANNGVTNLVLRVDVSGWFMGENDVTLDPTNADDHSQILNNIRKSFHVFEDEDHDGEPDDDGGDSGH